MKLGTLKTEQSKDGELVVISRDLNFIAKVGDISPNLRTALENWTEVEPKLQERYRQLNQGELQSKFDSKITAAMPYDEMKMASALPRTWLFADGSAFIHHIKLVRMARKAALPETLLTVPLIYQGESGQFLDPRQDIVQLDKAHGTDFEAEVGVITDFVPMGIGAEAALEKIRLIVLINDVSLRGLIPEELAQGFGFFQSKPASALSPVAVTPDELGEAWRGGRVHLPLHVKYKDEFFGRANAGEMHFHFGDLIAHAARTRDLVAGSLIGSGTVANADANAGSSCLAEKRMIEQIEKGQITTPFMSPGDTVEIWMNGLDGSSLFGRIYQQVSCH